MGSSGGADAAVAFVRLGALQAGDEVAPVAGGDAGLVALVVVLILIGETGSGVEATNVFPRNVY